MDVVFRADSSTEIGLGHVIRCLAVAKELKDSNNVVFASVADQTNSYITDAGFEIIFKNNNETEEDFLLRVNDTLRPDVIVLDKKYPYSMHFLTQLKQNHIKIVMLDNLCEGMAAADEIIFPIAHLDKEVLKEYLSDEQIHKVKTGFEYVIVRDEIIELKCRKSSQMHVPPNIVVTTGGSDPRGVLLCLIPWFKDMKIDANITILVGHSFKYRSELNKLIVDLPENIAVKPYSAEELAKGDLAICTFGVSIYELIYLQIPTICISHSRENVGGARILKDRCGVIEDLGYIGDLNFEVLFSSIKYLLSPDMGCSETRYLIDGNGENRVGNIIA